MRHFVLLAMVLGCSCKKSEETSKQPETPASAKSTEPGAAAKAPAEPPAPAAQASSAPMSDVGVEPGGIARDASEGPAAVVTAIKGTVEIRRVGETSFAAASATTKLYPGDVIRTGEAGSATITLADQSVIEVAEVSSVAIASRAASADPASSAAVLAGLARFSVAERAPGEGAFRVYTPAGVVITRGTVYGVGVAASGDVKVGVESGVVDVIGLAQLTQPPIAVEGGSQVTLAANGSAGAAAPWPADDWGTWRADVDASAEVPALVDVHASAMADIDAQLTKLYADLSASADQVATFEATASASADKGDTAAYEAALPQGAASIDASFAIAGQAEALTWANAAHGTIATDLYVRHPDVVGPKWEVIAPRVDASVLWPKRFEVTAAGYLEPVRGQYYVHHPRGRVNAQFVGIVVPDFYAKVTPPTFETKMWAPEVKYTASARPVWVAAPSADWSADVKVRPAPMRASGGWYVRPATLKTKVLLGGDIRGKWDSRLAVGAPTPRANLRAAWKVPVGMKIKIGAPDLRAAANARARWNVDLGTVRATAGTGQAPDFPRAGIKANAYGRGEIKPPAVKVKVPAVKGRVDATVRDHRDTAAGAAANVKAGIKVKAPEVRIKAPSIKVKGEVKGGFKIGN